jgi:transaldolase
MSVSHFNSFYSTLISHDNWRLMCTSPRWACTLRIEWMSELTVEGQDATTNISLILAVTKQPGYVRLIDAAIKHAKAKGGDIDAQANTALDRIGRINFFSVHRTDWTHVVVCLGSLSSSNSEKRFWPSRVSTEVDAHLSFDKAATKAKAKELIALYKSVGIPKERVLINTWEGIQATRELERDDGIHCNLTLLFGFDQAVACAEAD